MKCKFCGKYEGREKEIGRKKLNVSDEIEIPIFHYWKWCKKHNNWCRNVAGSCGEIVRKAENKIEVQANEIF
jgi:hypothetical protein